MLVYRLNFALIGVLSMSDFLGKNGKKNILFFLISLFSLLLPTIASSQVAPGAENNRPDVSVSLYLIDETDLCGPYGLRGCPGYFSIHQIEILHRNGYARLVEDSVPPEDINLSGIYHAIDGYASGVCTIKKPCLYPKDRKVVVLVFEIVGNGFAGSEIQLRRIPSDTRMPSYVSPVGTISEGGRWLNYQRADAFFPGYEIEHILTVGSWRWSLGFVR